MRRAWSSQPVLPDAAVSLLLAGHCSSRIGEVIAHEAAGRKGIVRDPHGLRRCLPLCVKLCRIQNFRPRRTIGFSTSAKLAHASGIAVLMLTIAMTADHRKGCASSEECGTSAGRHVMVIASVIGW